MDSFLMHYGVAGQKWGVRRYQNEDGTLTEEGRIRYLKSLDEHRRSIYEGLNELGKKRMDYHLASGKDFDEAFRASAQDGRKAVYKGSLMSRAGTFIAGHGAQIAGGIALSRGHVFLGNFLKGFGKGMKIGSVAGAAIDTVGNAVLKDKLAKVDIEKEIIPDKKRRNISD